MTARMAVSQIARIVHGIEDTKHVDTVDGRPLDEFLDHVVGIMTITEDVLSPEQHLLPGIGHGLLQRAQAFPRILAEIADT